MLLLLHSLLEQLAPPEPPAPPPAAQGGAGPIKLRKPGHAAPWHWVQFNPVAPKRPRKKRDTELLFLGH